jgi:hypothetical protein
MRFRHLAPLFAVAFVIPALAADPLTTISEQSGFRITGRYDEVDRLCHAFAKRYANRVKCFSFGTTPEGRPIWALAASDDGVVTAKQARDKRRLVILAQGGIHAGEIDGKDAGFLVLREFLEAPRGATSPLANATFLFVPVFSPDGHERFGKWNRPNQNGPEEMGWRTTAQNYNLNRDYAKADAPEMQAMHRLLNEWDPFVYIDLHATDGAQFEHDVAVMSEPREYGDREVAILADKIRDEIIDRLTKEGSLPLSWYPSFRDNDQPTSGADVTPSPPRFSTGYWGLSNRVALLVETHSWKDYPTRVRITANILRALFDMAETGAAGWQITAQRADERAARLAGTTYPLAFDVTDDVRWFDFRGYAYERRPSEVSGALMTRYDPTKPAIWRMPLHDTVRVTRSTSVPRSGYLIPPAVATWLAPKLETHGITVQPAKSLPKLAQVWRASAFAVKPETFEGHSMFDLKGTWKEEPVSLPRGTMFVPIAQPKSRLVLALLEPDAPDSYASWGFFATSFEKKEYMEPYVAEEVAREMLKDPAVRKEFDAKLKSDPKFAADPAARLEFFYRKHSSWDSQYARYPIVRF